MDSDEIKSLRILHIEDSILDAELILERLSDFECPIHIDLSSNEKDFIQLLRQGGYDIILADYRLPNFDALAALALTKSLCPGTPFICVSGAIGEEKAVELLKFGATDYVLKDRLDKLPIALRRALDEVNERKERKLMEDALILERQRLASIIKSTNVGTWEWNVQTGETVFNERWAEILGYKLEEISPVSIDTWMRFAHPDDLKASDELLEKHFRGELDYYEFEARMKHKDDRWVWVFDRGKVTSWTEDGKPLMMFGTHQDITERKQADEKIKSLLAEKEIILKEVHHRIKNNMNTTYGLLSLQAGRLKEPIAIAALEDAGSRVQCMAILYDKLYRSTDVQAISVLNYIPSLVDEILANFPNGNLVKVEKDVSDFVLDVKRLQPIGIIINELLTNIMKYAFIGRTNGIIIIEASLKPAPNGNGHFFSFVIADNGNGMPESINFDNSTGFGLELIRLMTKQLKGNIRIERENGTKVVLEFNK
jgi:PAS domain S-box-containing protein